MNSLEKVRGTLSKKDDDKVLCYNINALYTEFLNQSRDTRLLWLVCSAFARGIHYAVIDRDHELLVTPALPEGRKRAKVNKIGSWKKQIVPRIAVVRPEWDIEPLGTTNDDLVAAQTGKAFLAGNAEENKWKMQRFLIASYCADFGNCFSYIRDYNNNEKMTPIVQKDEDGTELIDAETGKVKIEYKSVIDVGHEVLLPHNVLCDNSPDELDRKTEIILSFWRPLHYFRKYKNGDKVKSEHFKQTASAFDLSALSLTSNNSGKLMEGATEKVFLQKPNGENEKGLVVISCGDVVLYKGDWMYKSLESYPLVHYRWGPAAPGEFWSDPPIKDQIPLQKDINEVASIIMENISNMGHKKWMNPIGSGVSSLDDLAGEIISYKQGYEPRQSQVTPLPHYEVNHLLVLDKLLEDIQNLHSVSKGTGTPNVRSALGLDKLSEEDMTPLGTIDAFFEESYKELGLKILKIAAEKVSLPMLVKYIGGGRKRRIEKFTGSMLDSRARVSVRMVDEHLRRRGEVEQLILGLAQNGLIVDNFGRPDPTQVRKMLEFALPSQIYSEDDTQRDIALEENDLLMDSPTEVVSAREWENHFIHMKVHEELLNSAEVRGLRRTSPEVEGRIVQHRMEHQQLLFAAISGQANTETVPKEGAQPQ
jgi:hypothetical protein